MCHTWISILTLAHSRTHRLGGENLAVAQNTYAVNWFKGKELNMVFGIQVCIQACVYVCIHYHNSFPSAALGQHQICSPQWFVMITLTDPMELTGPSSLSTTCWRMVRTAYRLLVRHSGLVPSCVLSLLDAPSLPPSSIRCVCMFMREDASYRG